MTKKIIIGSDHAGFKAKEKVKKILDSLNYKYIDLGTDNEEPVDYPIIAQAVCKNVKKDKTFGILICGSGEGMQIVANKIKGIRANLCYDKYSAKMARFDNDANVLTLRGREFDPRKYKLIVKTFLETPFSNEPRHIRRIQEISNIEKNN